MKTFHHLLILSVHFPSSPLLMIECIPSMHISWSRECFKHEFWLSLDGNTWLLHFLVLSDDWYWFLGIPLCSDSTPDEGSNAVNGYGTILIVGIMSAVLMIPFKAKLLVWDTRGIVSCGFWYLHLAFLVQVSTCFALVMLTRQYKARKREDVLPNEHHYTERYYSKRLATWVPL